MSTEDSPCTSVASCNQGFDANKPLNLGCHNMDNGYGTARFDGRIRDVRVYLRQLAADEVTQFYVNGPTLHAPPPSDAGPADAATD